MNFLIPIILMIISVGIFITYINPEYQKSKDLQVTIQAYNQKINNSSNIRKKRAELATKKTELEKNDMLAKLNKFLPDHINNIELIVDIDRIAQENNIRIENIVLVSDLKRPQQKENSEVIKISDGEKYQSTSISFSFITNYENLKSFLVNIRKSLRLLDVVSLEFGRIDDDKKSSNLQVQMSVRAY